MPGWCGRILIVSILIAGLVCSVAEASWLRRLCGVLGFLKPALARHTYTVAEIDLKDPSVKKLWDSLPVAVRAPGGPLYDSLPAGIPPELLAAMQRLNEVM